MTEEQIKQRLVGEWVSIAPEIRPSAIKTAEGNLKPFYLSRTFRYHPGDKFELEIVNMGDPYGKVPIANLSLKGQIVWQGDHPIVPDAKKVQFIADAEYLVTPLLGDFANVLNKVAKEGFDTWQVNVSQSILKKAFVPFGLAAGQVFEEYDLIYLRNDLLFWGARNVDGRGFDKEENRPTNLQIPLVKKLATASHP